MRVSHFLLLPLFVIIISSCEECIIDPPQTQYATGDTIWIQEIPGSDTIAIQTPGNTFLSIAMGTDGSIYYGASNPGIAWIAARIFALNKEDGSLKWQTEQLDHIGFSGQIVVGDDGTIYAIGYHKLYAIDPETGAFKWIWEVPQKVAHPDWPNGAYTYAQLGALALTNNGDLVLGTGSSGVYSRCLFCVDKNGNTKWYNLDANGGGIGSITVGQNGILYYYSEIEGKLSLLAVNPASGGINWTKEISSYSSYSNNIIIDADGFLICSFKNIGDSEFYLHRLDPANGTIVWKSTATSVGIHKLMGPDGAIYEYFSFEGGMNRFDPQTGQRVAIRGGNIGAIDDQNRLLFGYINGEPYYNRKISICNSDGTLDWAVSMNGLRDEDFLISNDKVIYGVNNSNQLFAIQGDAKLASSGWPKKAHDNRNTNNWNK